MALWEVSQFVKFIPRQIEYGAKHKLKLSFAKVEDDYGFKILNIKSTSQPLCED